VRVDEALADFFAYITAFAQGQWRKDEDFAQYFRPEAKR